VILLAGLTLNPSTSNTYQKNHMTTITEPVRAEKETAPKRIPDGRVFLKVKLKSLAAEARIIRQQELRSPGLRDRLREHRIFPVRREARNTLVAYGYLRGRDYLCIENAKSPPDWAAVTAMVKKYGAPAGPGAYETTEAHRKRMAGFENWKTLANRKWLLP